jgi:hypothetical protein
MDIQNKFFLDLNRTEGYGKRSHEVYRPQDNGGAAAHLQRQYLLELFLEQDSTMKAAEKIICLFKYENLYNLDEKLRITNYILINYEEIRDCSDFYEEECHLCLVNWVYALKNEIQKNAFVDVRIYHLIYNILNIFESFPIELKDLFNLDIYQKFNSVRQVLKKINGNNFIFSKIDCLLNYWKSFTEGKMLNKKRLREAEQEYIYNLLENEKLNLKKKKLLNECKNESQSNNLIKSILKKKDNKVNSDKIEKKSISWVSDEEIKKIQLYNVFNEPINFKKINETPDCY